jgi:catechol 2,3-dioxygenase-like lactoylglutathione lyase family enzyme
MIRGGVITLRVKDVGASVRFYVETLGMKLVSERERSAILDAGDGFQVALESAVGALPATSSVRVDFTTKVPLREAIAIYENRGVVFEEHDGIASFRDPDGHLLSLTAPASSASPR